MSKIKNPSYDDGADGAMLQEEESEMMDEEIQKLESDPFANQKNPETPEEVEDFLRTNSRLIHAILRPYRGLDEYEDLMQEAYIGFLKGIQTYNSRKGVKLTTYAYVCAKNQVKMYLRKNSAKSRTATVLSLESSFSSSDDKDKDNLLNRDLERMNPLNEPVSMEDRIHTHSVFEAAMHILKTEMTAAQQVVICRYMEGVPQSKTAVELNTSQSEISKIQKSAICELKLRMRERGYISLEE